jgi:helix-turn-helix protein
MRDDLRTHTASGKALFVQLPYWLMDSPRWQRLRPAAVRVWLQLVRQYDGQNNGRVFLSTRDAAAFCDLDKNTAASAIKQLEDEGLIENVRRYSASRTQRLAPEWRFTHLPCNVTGLLPTLTHEPESSEPEIIIATDAGAREKRKGRKLTTQDYGKREFAGMQVKAARAIGIRPPIPIDLDRQMEDFLNDGT